MERRRHIHRWLEVAFRLHPGELRPTLLMFLQCHAVVGAFVVGRAARDALFLARLSPAALPWAISLGSLAAAAAGFAYARLAAHRRLDRLMPATALLFAASLVAVRLGLPRGGRWLEAALYPWVEVVGAITVLQFWSFANEVHDSREAKRLFGLISAGGTLAAVVAGLAVSGLSGHLGVDGLLWLAALLLAAAGGLAVLVARGAGPRHWTPRPRARAAPSEGWAAAEPHLRALVVLAVLAFLATTFVDYQFKAAAAAHFGPSRGDLARFFGWTYAATGLVGLVLQVGLSARILDRLGVAGALALLPAALAATCAAGAAAGGLAAATLAKGAEQTLRYTVSENASQLLYLPLPALRRARAKALVDGVVRPAAIAGAGLLLAALAGRGTAAVALAALVLSLLWLAWLFPIHARYIALLRDALRRRRLDLAAAPQRFTDQAARAVRRALASPDPAEVEGALLLASRVEADLSGAVVPLLGHPSPRVRVLACQALGRSGSEALSAEVGLRLADPEVEVRAAALGAYCAMARDKALRGARPFLCAPEPEVRGAVVAGLIRHGGLDGILVAVEALKGLLASPRPGDRVEAARVLGAVGAKSFHQALLGLLGDPEPEVRRVALAAAADMRSPELLPALIHRLGRRESARGAGEAIAAYGPGVEPALARVLANPREDLARRRAVPRVLGRLATPEAAAILIRHVDAEDEWLRHAVDQALVRTVRRRGELALDRDRVGLALGAELALACRALAAAEALGLSDGLGPPPPGSAQRASHLLGLALREQGARAVDRALLLTRVLHPGADLELAGAALADGAPARRAAAVEMLDAVLPRRLRRRLVPLLDGRPRAARLREAEEHTPMPSLSPEAWVGELLRDESPWLSAAAAHFAGASGMAAAAPRVRELLAHHSPFVREAALAALERLLPPAEAAGAARELAADPFEPARRRAERLVAAAGAREEAQA